MHQRKFIPNLGKPQLSASKFTDVNCGILNTDRFIYCKNYRKIAP